jgi:flagellin-like hook-associated protein FlgL
LAVNDVATGLTILSGGPIIYVSGVLAPPPPYTLSGTFITINDSGVSTGAVTYSYNIGFTGSSSGIVTAKTASFPLTPPLADRESVAAVYVSGVPLPASGYSASSTAITFAPGYEPASGQAITADIAAAWLSSFRIDPPLTNEQSVSGVYIDGVQVPSSGYSVRPPDAIDFLFAYAPLSGQAVSAGINTVDITSLWLSDDGLDTASSQLDRAVKTLRSESAALASNLSVVTIRQGFTQGMVDTLLKGADELTLADMNEEGANMLMLQTRQQLGTTSLSMSSQSARSIQSLFE